MKVAVAVIYDEQRRILVTQRPYHVSHGGYWEFPGGKLEPGESGEQALAREIKEEVNLTVEKAILLDEIHYQYEDKKVHLLIYQVTQYSGQAQCCAGQLDLQWLIKNELLTKQFPEANQEIFALLK